MHIKICGITNLEEGRAAARAGANILGFNFYPRSPRCIRSEECGGMVEILRAEYPSVKMAGVFVNCPAQAMIDAARKCVLDWIQLAGEETPAVAEQLAAQGISCVKVVRAGLDSAQIAAVAARAPRMPALLLDAKVPGEYGGTGRTADWNWAAAIAGRYPILLAGGLTPENVHAAIRAVHPWGVDTASGVESAPGRKDPAKMAAFVAAARAESAQLAVRIEPAGVSDAAEILALQKLAYRSEAELNQDYSIPPLTQTLPEIESEFGRVTVLKAVADGVIIGSVRAGLGDGTCAIGRLIVHPDWQNRGLGTRLLAEIEARFPAAQRFELFTSERSLRNLYLYQKRGYTVFRRERLNESATLVYLEKERVKP